MLAGLMGAGIRLLVALVATALFGQWAEIPWGRWAIVIAAYFAVEAENAGSAPPPDVEPPERYRRYMEDWTALLPTIVRESDVRELADFTRRWLRLPVMLAAGVAVAAIMLLACVLFTPDALGRASGREHRSGGLAAGRLRDGAHLLGKPLQPGVYGPRSKIRPPPLLAESGRLARGPQGDAEDDRTRVRGRDVYHLLPGADGGAGGVGFAAGAAAGGGVRGDRLPHHHRAGFRQSCQRPQDRRAEPPDSGWPCSGPASTPSRHAWSTCHPRNRQQLRRSPLPARQDPGRSRRHPPTPIPRSGPRRDCSSPPSPSSSPCSAKCPPSASSTPSSPEPDCRLAAIRIGRSRRVATGRDVGFGRPGGSSRRTADKGR